MKNCEHEYVSLTLKDVLVRKDNHTIDEHYFEHVLYCRRCADIRPVLLAEESRS